MCWIRQDAVSVSCLLGAGDCLNVRGWSETGNDWIPSSLRWSSRNTLGPCAAEVSYLFFLSCWARFPTVFTRGSHAFQQWCIMDHREILERVDCFTEGHSPNTHTHSHPSMCFSHFNSFLSTSSSLFDSFWTINIEGHRPGHSGVAFEHPPPSNQLKKNLKSS